MKTIKRLSRKENVGGLVQMLGEMSTSRYHRLLVDAV